MVADAMPAEPRQPIGLVLAPFGGAWGSVHEAVRDALAAAGIELVWVNGEAELNASIAARIHELLDRADFVIADLTESNPNVMYEMGYAHALRRPVLPVVERSLKRVPPTLQGRLYFVYERGKPESLIAFITRWAGPYMARVLEEQPVG